MSVCLSFWEIITNMRIQLLVSDAQQAMIENLRQQIGAATIKEVFNNALTLLNWAVRQRQEGLAICAINDERDVYKELQLPALDYSVYIQTSSRPEMQKTAYQLPEATIAPAPMQAVKAAAAAPASAKGASAGKAI
jgi:hypothetical protein